MRRGGGWRSKGGCRRLIHGILEAGSSCAPTFSRFSPFARGVPLGRRAIRGSGPGLWRVPGTPLTWLSARSWSSRPFSPVGISNPLPGNRSSVGSFSGFGTPVPFHLRGKGGGAVDMIPPAFPAFFYDFALAQITSGKGEDIILCYLDQSDLPLP